jgi:hypothetical protein
MINLKGLGFWPSPIFFVRISDLWFEVTIEFCVRDGNDSSRFFIGNKVDSPTFGNALNLFKALNKRLYLEFPIKALFSGR